jgi:hypothetical protein
MINLPIVQVQTLSLVVVTFTYLLVGAAIFGALEEQTIRMLLND